jgi:sugar phosphate permease
VEIAEALSKFQSDGVKRDSEGRPYWTARVFVAAWIGYAGFYFCRKNISWTPLPVENHQSWLSGLADS